MIDIQRDTKRFRETGKAKEKKGKGVREKRQRGEIKKNIDNLISNKGRQKYIYIYISMTNCPQKGSNWEIRKRHTNRHIVKQTTIDRQNNRKKSA